MVSGISAAGGRPPGRYLVTVPGSDIVVVLAAVKSLTISGSVRVLPHAPGVGLGLVGPGVHLVVGIPTQVFDGGFTMIAVADHPLEVVVASQTHVIRWAVSQGRIGYSWNEQKTRSGDHR